MAEKNRYKERGVSSGKEDLKVSLKHVTKPVAFKNAFCQGIENPFPLSPQNITDYYYFHHADGIGTKGSIAYLHYQETGGIEHFAHLIQDAWVMNSDDLLCIGAVGPFTFSTIISRNKKLIPAEVLQVLIAGEEKLVNFFKKTGITFINLGGETADMGDITKSLAVDATCTTFVHKNDFIDNGNIRENLVIVGLASFGQTTYENEYNSGIGCNGLTSAKHDLLAKKYKKHTESYDGLINTDFVYQGNFSLSDRLKGTPLTIGEALLSPTRTYLPVMKEIFNQFRNKIHGLIHNSGGGQTKCLNFSNSIHFIKDNLFDFPPIFQELSKKTSLEEMFSVYNCGHRLEIYTDEDTAKKIISLCENFQLSAKIIGRTEKNPYHNNKLTIQHQNQKFHYERER